MGTRTGAFIAASSVLAVAGCGTEFVPSGALEASIRSHARVPLRSVSCPSGVEAKTGNTLRCSLRASDGSRGTLTVHITSVSGTTVRWNYGVVSDYHQPASAGSRMITSTDGRFAAVVPPGFVDLVLKPAGYVNQPAFEFVFLVVGPVVEGYRIRVSVVRQPLAATSPVGGRHDIDSIARSEVSWLQSRGTPTYGLSPFRSLTVGGEPARAVDFFSKPPPANRVLHDGAIVVAHGRWIYTLIYAAPPSDYAAHVTAPAAVVDGWQWR